MDAELFTEDHSIRNSSTESNISNTTEGYNTTIASDIFSELNYDETWKFTLSHHIRYYANIIFVILGIFGNALCLYILSQKHMKNTSSTYMLKTLTLVDLILIILVESVNFPTFFLNWNPTLSNRYICKMSIWLNSTFTHFSSYILAGFSIDRCIAVTLPLWYLSQSHIKTIQRVYIVISFLIMLALNSFTYLTFDVSTIHTGNMAIYDCATVNNEWSYFGIPGGEMIGFILTLIIPVTVIMISNCTIIIMLVRNRKEMKNTFGEATKHGSTNDKERSVILMLVLVSVTCLLLLTPFNVMTVLFISEANLSYGTYTLLFTISLFCQHLNSAINFILYMLSGKFFREKVYKMVLQICKKCTLKSAGKSTSAETRLETTSTTYNK